MTAMRVKSFFKRVSRTKVSTFLQFVEACFFLTAATAAVRLLPFRIYAPLLGRQIESIDALSFPDFEQPFLIPCIHALRRGSRYLPLECKCLVQALAARGMLGIRRIPSIAHFGVTKDEAGTLKAHAWVKVGEIFVTGKGGAEEYSEITRFSTFCR